MPVKSNWDYFQERALSEFDDNFAVDFSQSTQRARFEDLQDAFQLTGRTVLDFGCGTGALVAHLPGDFPLADYRGVDFSPAMVDRAKARHPGVSFEIGDETFLETALAADVVVAIGVYNLEAPDLDSLVDRAMRGLFEFARLGCYFSFTVAAPGVSFGPHIRAWSPEWLFSRALDITPWIRVNKHYLPHDMSVTMLKSHPGDSRKSI